VDKLNANTQFEKPRWLRDLLRFLPLKSQFVLSGNVRDLQLCELAPGAGSTTLPLVRCLASELRAAGYAHVLAYDPINGFRSAAPASEDPRVGDALLSSLGLQPADGRAPAGLELFGLTLERIVGSAAQPIALVADFASQLLVRPDLPTPQEHQAFTRALVCSHAARPVRHQGGSRPLFNSVIWIVEKEGDLPDWLLVDNPRVRHIPIAKPDHHARRVLAHQLVRSIDGEKEATPTTLEEAVGTFVDETEGLLLVDLVAIHQLGREERLGLARVADAVRRYKVGVTEDPWARIDRAKIRGAGAFIRRRVKGQDHAVTHMLDVIKRAVTGVGGARRGGRPRGVAFLVGPTGTGKTELAKTITSLLFGDERAYIRFDMSEFSAEHADQRLIGAPPGYVGYDVGGELTNAVRERPFSVVLFDEIEKAHPRILDKFLQVLDDGVLTSGRGDRVYFSEAFIVFTSNLGIYRLEPDGTRVPNVSPDTPFEEVQARVRAEIERHFKLVLNRPEILNRIGENVIVFDFIREQVAGEILEAMVSSTLADLGAGQGIAVSLSEQARQQLRALCLADLGNGGRGIRNKVEAHLVNPLARALFDADVGPGSRIVIDGLEAGGVTHLVLRAANEPEAPS
jgi:hypothetical protein